MPRRPKKGKSTSLLMRNLIKELNPLELTVLRERIVHICEVTRQHILLNPENYVNVPTSLIISSVEKTISILSYDDEIQLEKEIKPKTEFKISVAEEVQTSEPQQTERELVEV